MQLHCLEAGEDCSDGDAPPHARVIVDIHVMAAALRVHCPDQGLTVVLLGSEQFHGLRGRS